MITLEQPTNDLVTKLYILIDKDREYYSVLPWAATCTELSLIRFFEDKKHTQDIIYVICNGNTPVGVIDGRVANDTIDIGYWIGKHYSSQGYTTTAVKKFITDVNARVFTARALKTNIESNRVLEKAGFDKIRTDNLFNYYSF